MFGKNTVISGLVSGAILAAASFATPASAGQATLRLDVGISSFFSELLSEDGTAPTVQNVDYNGVPIRKIHRKMRRRGLYPVSEYRLRGDVVIIRAEDEYGTLFRVVADADYGDILKIRRVRATSNYRPAPVEPRYYDDGYDNYRPGYDRPARRNKRGSTHAERKAAKDAAARAHARRKAAKTTHAQRKAAKIRADQNRRAAQARADTNRRARQARADANRRAAQAAQARGHAARKAAKLRADANRRARQARADTNRRAAQARADRNRRASTGAAKKPYVGLSPEEYKKQQYGGGK